MKRPLRSNCWVVIVKEIRRNWIDGPLTQAVQRTGSSTWMRSPKRVNPDVLVAIHSLTDHRRMLFLDRHHEVLRAQDDFMLVASFNPGYQRGYKELKPSTRQRFVTLSFRLSRTKASKRRSCMVKPESIARSRISWSDSRPGFAAWRNWVSPETASTRLLVDAARKLIHSGMPPRLSVR